MGLREFMRRRSIRVNIMASFVLLSIIFIGGIGGLTFLLFQRAGVQTITDSTNALESQILANIDATATKNAEIIDEKLSSAEAMVRYMGKEYEYLFSDENRYGFRESYYDQWFNNTEFPGMAPPDTHYDASYDLDLSWDYASYYIPGVHSGNYTNLTPGQNQTVETLASMDYVYQSIHNQAPDFRWLYISMPIGNIEVFINYPGSIVGGSEAERLAADHWVPSTDEWYSDVHTGSYDDIVFVAPYFDPVDGVPLITIGRNVRFDNGTLIGVICGDISLETMVDKIKDVEVLETGYASLITSDGLVVAHEEVNNSAIDDLPTIDQVEINIATNTTALNSTQLAQITSGESGIIKYSRDGEERYLAYQPLGKGDYISLIIVSVEEALAGIEPVVNRMESAMKSNLNTIWIIVGVSFGIGITVGLILTAYITRPFTHLIKVAQSLSTRRARKDIMEGIMTDIDPDLLRSEDELGELTRAFKGMIDSVQQAEREKDD